ncbi:MAG: large repetitive protein, partial [Acidimicrobiaceae bacterium]|nr:large repetitive protein [Acidimicrobiaceae bacterium]
VTVMVNGAADDTATTTPGQAAVIDVAANDPCTDCTISGLGAPAAGTATLNQAGTVTYTPPAGFSGTTSFTYQVSKNGHATSATVTVTVLPAAVDDNVATAAGSPVTLDPRGNDLCVACVVTSAAAPDGGGTAVVAPDGRAITYTPGVPAGHVEHFAYTVTDTEGHTASATVTVAVDAPPTASADSATTDAGIPVVTDVLANDTCAGCTPDVASDPTHGTVVFRADGKAQYRPAAGFSGVDSFRYLVTDPVTGLAATATVTVAVLPKAADDMVATAEGVALTIDIQANDSCTSCAVTIPTGPSHGGATVNPDGTVHYTPGLAFQGSDQLSYRLTDPATGTAVTATAFVTVSNATADSATTTVTTSVDIDVLANDTCASCSIVAVGYPAHGTAAVVAGRIRYTPASGFWGLDHFTYAAGASGTSSPATVTVMVAPPLRHVTGDTNATVTGSLLGDAPCATCVFTVVAAPAGGDITLNADGTWSYTPVAGTNPDDTITYRVNDPVSGTTVTGTLTISVRPSQVTVTVAVVNDNGGTRAVADFPVTLNGASVTSGATNTLPSGVSYTVGMAAVAGYAATSVDCADIDTLATSGHPFTLAPGQRVACTVTEDDVAAGAHVSLAATATGPVDANSSGRTDAGDTVGYGYQVTNTGTTTATGLQVGDGHVSTSAIGCGSTASNTVASLASGVSVTCAASYTITQADIDAGSISTVASVTGDPVGGAAVTATDTTAVTLPRANGVAVTTTETGRDDTDANGHDSAGDVIHYHVAGTNTGTTTLTGAATGNSITTDATACATLAPGLTCIADTSYVVTQADVDAGTLDIVGTATGHGPDAAAVVAHATATSTLAAPAPSLSIAQSLVAETDTDHSGTRNAGDVLTYDITVASSGGRTAHTVVVVDDLTGDSSNCGSLAPAVTCTLRTIHTVTAAEGLAEAVVNTAHATASDAATMSTSLSVAIVHRNGLSITALLDQLDTTTVGPVGRVDAGDHAHYRYTITNTGESSLHEITITGPLAAAAICPSGNATVADLAAGASVPCTADHVFDQAEVDAGALDAGAHAAGTTAGGAAAQLEASVALTTGLPAQPGLALAETVAPGATCQAAGPQAQVERGSDVTWCFAVTNTGNVTMTNVGLTDPALGFVDGGPQPAPFDTPTALTPGQTATAHVTTSAAGDVTDTARAQGRHSGATALSPDATAAVTTITPTTTTVTTTTPDGHEVAGIIWFDSNGNGGRDHGEPALPGVHVSLERDSSTIAARLRMVAASSASGSATTVTGPDGRYSFAGVTPGRYTIFASIGGSGLPATWDTDGHADWQVGVSIQGNDATADFATTPPGAINGRVTDLATAAGIAGAQVDCAWAGIDGVAGTADDVVFTTVAGADGSYGQTGIPPGDFACRATDPLTGAHKLFAAAVEAGQATRADAELGQPVSLPPVTEAPAPVFAGALVHTGLDPRRRAAGGAALVLLGLALTMAARRRDRATPRGRPRSGPAAGGR